MNLERQVSLSQRLPPTSNNAERTKIILPNYVNIKSTAEALASRSTGMGWPAGHQQ
jgi:hypothetical protein